MSVDMRIERAYDGDESPDGWDLFVDGEWANRFPTRSDARDAFNAVRNLNDPQEGSSR